MRGDVLCFHIPVRAQTGHQVILGAHRVRRQPADAVITHANVVHVGVRDTGPVTANATGVTASVAVLEAGRRGEVQTGVRARFPQGMAGNQVSNGTIANKEKQMSTYGLGITASSSNADARGV